jgi:hypothetical protein
LLNRLHATTSYTLDPIHLGLTFLNYLNSFIS